MANKRNRGPGVNAAAEYMVSGTPFVTSSGHQEIGTSDPIRIKFPYVTSWFQIRHSGSAGACTGLRIGFTSNGVKGQGAVTSSVILHGMDDEQANNHRNYFVIPKAAAGKDEGTLHLNLKCTNIFLLAEGGAAGCTVVAGLTGIPDFPVTLSGSNGFFGIG